MSEFQPINIADGEEEIIVIKKTKNVKSKLFLAESLVSSIYVIFSSFYLFSSILIFYSFI